MPKNPTLSEKNVELCIVCEVYGPNVLYGPLKDLETLENEII